MRSSAFCDLDVPDDCAGRHVWKRGVLFCRDRREEWKKEHGFKLWKPSQDTAVPTCDYAGDAVPSLFPSAST